MPGKSAGRAGRISGSSMVRRLIEEAREVCKLLCSDGTYLKNSAQASLAGTLARQPNGRYHPVRGRKLRGRVTEQIETARCRLTALEPADREDVAALYRCRETRRYLGGVLDEQSFADRFSRMLGDDEGRNWTIFTRDGHSFVGLVSIDRHHDGQDFEISYQILPALWGKGLGLETVRALIDYASSVLGLPKLVGETQTANLRSRKLLEQLGMTPLPQDSPHFRLWHRGRTFRVDP